MESWDRLGLRGVWDDERRVYEGDAGMSLV